MTSVAVVLIALLAVAVASGSLVRAGRMTKRRQAVLLSLFGVALLLVAGLAWHNART